MSDPKPDEEWRNQDTLEVARVEIADEAGVSLARRDRTAALVGLQSFLSTWRRIGGPPTERELNSLVRLMDEAFASGNPEKLQEFYRQRLQPLGGWGSPSREDDVMTEVFRAYKEAASADPRTWPPPSAALVHEALARLKKK